MKFSNPKIDFFIALRGGEEGRNRASGKESGTGTGSRLGTAHQPKPDFGARLFLLKIIEGAIRILIRRGFPRAMASIRFR
ncbi:MAG: hypothetical protein LAO76_25675 [Acidobacteriia bacterium]|nr:hypothetical protein [Terriglobia bacterium]